MAAPEKVEAILGHCRICQFKYHCGGCRARAYAYFGDFKGPDPGCISHLPHWRSLIGWPELKGLGKRDSGSEKGIGREPVEKVVNLLNQ